MTKLEKKALLEFVSKVESQKKEIESILISKGLSPDFPNGILDDSANYLYGSLNAYRSCLAVLKSYFC